jgi:uncharacterized membrane protein
MARMEASVVINRPIEEVFAFAADPCNDATWGSGVVEVEMTSPGPLARGSTHRYVAQTFGRRTENAGEITVYDPPSRSAWKSTSGPFPVSGGLSFEAVNGGTRVTSNMEAEPGGFFALAAPLLARMFQRQMETDLKNLKDLLERGDEQAS